MRHANPTQSVRAQARELARAAGVVVLFCPLMAVAALAALAVLFEAPIWIGALK